MPMNDPNTVLKMDMELLEVDEYMDVDGDGRKLLRVIREGKKGAPSISDLSRVTAHFRIAKLLTNLSVKDTRMGLANGTEGLEMREDKTKQPLDFVVGEEDVGEEGDFVPRCIGQCLLVPPGGVTEGMRFELILRDGVRISELDKAISEAYTTGSLRDNAMPDTSGPVVVKVEVEKVAPGIGGPSGSGWQGLKSFQEERERAEYLEIVDDRRHWQKALKRRRRVLSWLEELLRGRRWRVLDRGLPAESAAAPTAGGSIYDLEWDADEDQNEGGDEGEGNVAAGAVAARGGGGGGTASSSTAGPDKDEEQPSLLFDVEVELLRQLDQQELCEWATAHSAIAQLLASAATLGQTGGNAGLAEQHARSAVQAAEVTKVPKDVEIAARSTLAARLLARDQATEAVEVLKAAQALDPTSSSLKDLAARATQRDMDHKVVSVKDSLRKLKLSLINSLEADDAVRLLSMLEAIDGMPLTWDAVSESAIGKEVGRCARHANEDVAGRAKAIVAKLHRLAKQERPLWVR